MTKAWLVPVLCAATLSPAAAWAGPTFAQFKALCLDTRGERTRALAAAEAQGLTIPPGDMTKSLGDGDMKNLEARAALVDGVVRVLLVADVSEIAFESPRAGRICAVLHQSGNIAELKAEAAQFAQVGRDAALVDDEEADAFAWRDTPAGRVQVAAKDIKTVAWDPSLSVLIAGSTGSSPIIALAVPSK